MFGGGNKSGGMEMMVQTILKSLGFTPEVIHGYVETGKNLANQFVGAMNGLHARQTEMAHRQAGMDAKLDVLMQGMKPAVCGRCGKDLLCPCPETTVEKVG